MKGFSGFSEKFKNRSNTNFVLCSYTWNTTAITAHLSSALVHNLQYEPKNIFNLPFEMSALASMLVEWKTTHLNIKCEHHLDVTSQAEWFAAVCCSMHGHGLTPTNACGYMICKYMNQKKTQWVLNQWWIWGSHRWESTQARDPPWLWKPGQTS